MSSNLTRDAWDVVVIGAGPAGCSAAIALARRGLRVLLLERKAFPRAKVCGGCLNPLALRLLAELGVREAVERRGAAAVRRLEWRAGDASATIALPTGLSVSRAVLDELLFEQARRAGATALTEARASIGELRGDGRLVEIVHDSQRFVVAARVVIVAAGLAGQRIAGLPSRRRLSRRALVGAGCVLETDAGSFDPGTIHMAAGASGYVGVARAESQRLSIAAALTPSTLREFGPVEASRRLLTDSGWPLPASAREAVWRGTPRLTSRRAVPAEERVFFVGDAAGYVEPFTGEGIGWALLGGQLVAPLAEEASRGWRPSLAAEWHRVDRRSLRRRQRTCRLVAASLRHPPLVRRAIHLARRHPWLVQPLVRRIGGQHVP